ncbi:uncharacterized protein LOC110443157 [Mizuhopecten yessoensis]|uniref:uncharacterized protein LOC110443157 n=1 Tax=Mizuhopecten yessoensis TaxID=6573 RepID=UPI000B45DBCA|nr:uncharacterized protein LOC110443157 [Mizuhopecten yessoensis]XP_021342867.1 uncharacterized protein LOC110443157 [Mizuhopecten yessoensis]XP_021342869.1 uncharacterized protein LOC110443157 [Mizuhopecten yessoensis]
MMLVSYKSVKCLLKFLLLLTVFLIHADGKHQRWYLLGCHCRNWSKWQFRKSFRDSVLSMYRGLFMNPRDLRQLPVIKPEGVRGHGLNSYVDGIRPRPGPVPNSKNSCCFTDYAYEVFNTTVSSSFQLNVVHFKNAFQFVPTGRCASNVSCGVGQCLQMYRHHWMLVWDDNLPHYPPVTFLPVEVPSHCECVNVGRSTSSS